MFPCRSRSPRRLAPTGRAPHTITAARETLADRPLVVALSVLATLSLLLLAGVLTGIGGKADGPEDEESPPSGTPRASPDRSTAAREASHDAGPTGDAKITSCAVDPATRWPG